MIKNEFFLDYNLAKNTVFLDMEKAGFSKDDDVLCICYARYFNDCKCKVTQILAINEENQIVDDDLISYFYEDILGFYEIYTFNGYEFEERILKYHKLDFSNFVYKSLKKNIKNFRNILGISGFSREEIENYFGITKNRYYDMNRIIRKINKEKKLDDFIINHNLEEISTLLDMNSIFTKMKMKNKVRINGQDYYIDDFEIVQDTVSLYFVSSKKYKYTKYYLDDAQKLIALQNNIKIDILTKNVNKQDDSIVLYELSNEYIPIFIKNEIIYQNIYFILEHFLKFI